MKRTPSRNQGKKLAGSSDPEQNRLSRDELLNTAANPSLFRTRDPSTTDDDSDIVSISRRGSESDTSQLTIEEKHRLLQNYKKKVRSLQKELEATDDTLTKNRRQKNRKEHEEPEQNSEKSGHDSEDNSEEEEEKDANGKGHDDEEITEDERKMLFAKMPSLTRIESDVLLEVLEIIRSDAFTIAEKEHLLEDHLTLKAVKECMAYIHEERCNFLKYGTPSRRNLAEAAISRKNFNHLKTIVTSWKNENANVALGFWLELHGDVTAKESPEDDKKSHKYEEIPKKKDKKKEWLEKETKKKENKREKTVSKEEAPPKMDRKKEEEVKNDTRGHFDPLSHRRIYSELEGIPFTKEMFDKCPKTMNIVIMGATGVGKSCFINNVMNLLAFEDLDDADSAGVEGIKVLIPTYFRHNTAEVDETTGGDKYIPIYMEPNVQAEKLGDTANEVHETGKSGTQSPKSYLFSWGPENNKKYIRLIDTPGILDCRGAITDKINVDQILNIISGFQEIHAICILMKANESRSTVISRYCLNELLGHLHTSATDNIFFGFTNSRGYDYNPGDSYNLMLEQLSKIKYPGQFDGKYFCFDSESFRYLCCRQNGITFPEDVANNYRRSFAYSKQQLFKMIEAIAKVQPHKVGQTLDVNNVRRLIMALLRPIAEMSKATLRTTRMLEDEIEELDEFEERGIDISQKMKKKVPKLVTQPLEYPKTVCASNHCTERKTIDGIDQIHYKTICHDHCYLHGIPTKIVNNTALQKCNALSGRIKDCRVCHCSWEFHMHITYTLATIMQDAIDSTMQAELQRITDKKEQAARTIDCFARRISDLNDEKAKILVFLVDALAYLTEHSIVPVNDAFVEYLDHIIDQTGDDNIREQLVEYRDEYNELILQQSYLKNYQVKTTQQMYRMIQELKQMKGNGDLFKDVQELELLQLKTEPSSGEKPLDLNRNWLGYCFYKMKKQF